MGKALCSKFFLTNRAQMPFAIEACAACLLEDHLFCRLKSMSKPLNPTLMKHRLPVWQAVFLPPQNLKSCGGADVTAWMGYNKEPIEKQIWTENTEILF